MVRWTEGLSVGVMEIDDQHKELFDRVNQLVQAMSQGKGKSEIDGVVSFLEEYVVTHFQTEEQLMISSRYPGYSEHKTQHAAFAESFKSIKAGIGGGIGSLTVIQLHRSVVDWLTSHIARSDKAFGAFLNSQQQRKAA